MGTPDRRVVLPVEGFRPTDRYGRRIPEDGAVVVWSSWWDRRLAEGAITFRKVDEAPPPEPTEPKSEPPPKSGGARKYRKPKTTKDES